MVRMRRFKTNWVTMLTLSFLLSGNILHGLYYSSGNPAVSFICISVFLALFTFLASKYFVSGVNISEKGYSRFFSVSAVAFAAIPLAYTVAVYTRMLGSFAGYYSTVQVTVFAVFSAVITGICAARKGVIALSGFARMTVYVMLVWILAGYFGFFHTKNIVPLQSVSDGVRGVDFVDIMKNAVLITVDTVFLFVVLTDNRTGEEKIRISHSALVGVWIYIAVSGINMLKNLLMFGKDFLVRLDNPDLAAIRLIPMFELPEISVVVNTFAVTVRVAVYLCALFYMLKDSFGEAYCTKKTEAVCFFAVSGTALAFLYFKNKLTFVTLVIPCIVMCALICAAFFSKRKKDKSCDRM